MTDKVLNEARAGLAGWAEEVERSFEHLAEVLAAPVPESRRDPALLVPYLDEFLSGLPLDQLKIDRSFVHEMPFSSRR